MHRVLIRIIDTLDIAYQVPEQANYFARSDGGYTQREMTCGTSGVFGIPNDGN